MGLTEFVDWLKSRPATVPTTVWIPDQPGELTSLGADGALEGYFEVSLSEMFLTDARKLFKEITPATFFIAEYDYGGSGVSQPLFVSNELLQNKEISTKIDGSKLRVRFVDTQVVASTPYTGGKVFLFVGLFQATMADHRKTLFSVFETLLGSVGLGGLADYVKMAAKLTSTILACLGETDVECLLAERRLIGDNQLPASGYLVYLHGEGKVDKVGLTVQDGFLHRDVGGVLTVVEDLDFCVVRVNRLARRNDYMKMAFHRTWTEARKKMVAQQVPEAQALMLECGQQILASPDLTEDHKIGLIEYYQAKLLAARTLLVDRSPGELASRSGAIEPGRQMQLRALESQEVDAGDLAKQLGAVAQLATAYEGASSENEQAQLDQHLKDRSRKGPQDAATLVRALATGSFVG